MGETTRHSIERSYGHKVVRIKTFDAGTRPSILVHEGIECQDVNACVSVVCTASGNANQGVDSGLQPPWEQFLVWSW